MRKLYTLLFISAFATAFAVSADAQGFAKLPRQKAAKTVAVAKANTPAADDADTYQQIDYDALTWKPLGYGRFQDVVASPQYTGHVYEVDVEFEQAVENPAIYRMVDPFFENFLSKASLILDATNPDCVVVPYAPIGIRDFDDGMTYACSYSWELMVEEGKTYAQAMEENAENMITLSDGLFTFGPSAMLLRWPDADPDGGIWGTIPDDYYGVVDFVGYTALPGYEIPTEWADMDGDGEMFEQILSPMYKIYATQPYAVKVQKSKQRPGVYRVLDPWKNFKYATETAPLVIDASDPDFVIIEEDMTGMNDTNLGPIYVSSVSSQYKSFAEMEADRYGDCNITLDEDGYINLPANCLLVRFVATSDDYQMVERGLDSYIQLPADASGIEGIIAQPEAVDGPAVYYNLQGQRVANPQHGLYIVRTGSTAKKVILK